MLKYTFWFAKHSSIIINISLQKIAKLFTNFISKIINLFYLMESFLYINNIPPTPNPIHSIPSTPSSTSIHSIIPTHICTPIHSIALTRTSSSNQSVLLLLLLLQSTIFLLLLFILPSIAIFLLA